MDALLKTMYKYSPEKMALRATRNPKKKHPLSAKLVHDVRQKVPWYRETQKINANGEVN